LLTRGTALPRRQPHHLSSAATDIGDVVGAKFYLQGSYGQGKSGNFEESEKTERAREKSGNFKIPNELFLSDVRF